MSGHLRKAAVSQLHVIRLLRQLSEAAFALNVALHDAAAATECLLAPPEPPTESPLAETAAA